MAGNGGGAAPRGVRRLWPALVVLALAAGGLRLLDAAVSLAIGAPRGVIRHETVEEAEQLLGRSLLLPSQLPEDLVSPPVEVLRSEHPTAAVSVGWRHRASHRIACRLVQSFPASETVPERLLPWGQLFDRRRIDLRGETVVLRQLEVPGDGSWDEIEWSAAGRRMVLRWRGPADVYVRMAESIGGAAR